MSNDRVSIWGDKLKFGRKPADGELLIGNGSGFKLSTMTQGPGVTISNTEGGIEISAVGSGGTVTGVTAESPLSSSGGNSPEISLADAVPANLGGTGQTSLTTNNLILGDGANPVKFLAPGTSGNIATSNGTTWVSSPPVGQWTRQFKTSDQSITSNNTTLIEIAGLSFNMLANTNYAIRAIVVVAHSNGGAVISFDGPASPTQVNALAYTTTNFGINSISGSYTSTLFLASVTASQSWTIPLNFVIRNGANAGDFKITFRQNASNVAATTVRLGSWIEYSVIS